MNTGFRLVIGSWKIIAMRLPRMSRICAGDRSSRFLPSNMICPAAMRPGGGTRRITDSDSTDLPQPDFADDAERAAAIDRDVHAIHRGDVAAGGAEHGAETRDCQAVPALPPCGGGLGRGRQPPPPNPNCFGAAHAVRNVGGEICSAVR